MMNKQKLARFVIIFAFALFFTSILSGQVIQTGCENSGYSRYTTYSEMLDYLQLIDTYSSEVYLGTYGQTYEARDLPFVVFSRPYISKSVDAINSGKPVVLLASNIHGDEKSLRESNLIMIRELGTPGTAMNLLLDSLVVIIVPSINPDGFVRSQRGNSFGVDMNRDFMKLEQPSLVNYVKNILLTWKPHLFIDGHNGGSYPYNICYLSPSNAACDQRLTLLADQEIFPYVDSKMEAAGYKSWYYSRGNNSSWTIGGSDPRIGRNYGGLINSMAILFEVPGGYPIKTDVLAGLTALTAILQYSARNAINLIRHVEQAREETISMGQMPEGEIPLNQIYVAEDYTVSYELFVNNQIVQITGAQIIKKPVITGSRPRPFAYILEPYAQEAVRMLDRHNIEIEVLLENRDLNVEGYLLTGIERGSLYDHPNAAKRVNVEDSTFKMLKNIPAGSFIIKTEQVMGRVATHLLEPESSDNIITWNTMDNLLPLPTDPLPLIPIYKFMTPVELNTTDYVTTVEANNKIFTPGYIILNQNYPNPFNNETHISFKLTKPENITIKIYDLSGREIKELINKNYPAGDFFVMWNGRDNQDLACGSGIYYFRLSAGIIVQTKRLLLIR